VGAGGIYETYTTGIAVFVHRKDRAEVAQRIFTDKESNVYMTWPESGISFFQMKVTMIMR
jgi:hypothetical protein